LEKQAVLDFIMQTQKRSEKPLEWVLGHLGLATSTYYRWRAKEPHGKLEDNYVAPFNFNAPLDKEIQAVVKYALEHPKEGYRRLSYMMIDGDVACLSPSSIYRILTDRDLLCRWKAPQKSKGTYDFKPVAPHDQWHTDLMYLWVAGRWYFFIGILDAFSRKIVHWELLEKASAADVRAAVQSAIKKHPGVAPRIVTDNGVQFTSKEFRKLVKEFSMKDIKIRIRHPQSNGKIERFHRSLREEGLGEKEFKDKYNALEIISEWVNYYNNERLHAGINYLRPIDYYNGCQEQRLMERKEKLESAAKARKAENRKRFTIENVKEQKNVRALPPHPQDLPLGAVPA
jgi:transposase InsO family protein